MAECRKSESSVDQYDPDNDNIVPGWTNGHDLDSQRKKYNIIYEIMKNRRPDQLRTILASGWDVHELLHFSDDHVDEYRVALHAATEVGWTEGVQILLDAGAKIRTSDKLGNLLLLALQHQDGQVDLIRLLLEHGADPNDHNDQCENIPLVIAIKNSNFLVYKNATMIVQLLLVHGANANITYRVNRERPGLAKWAQSKALHDAISLGWTEGVQMLLDAGAGCKTFNGQNPLALAVHSYNCPTHLIELLLKHGADPNDHDGQFEDVPLLTAIAFLSQNDTVIVDLLLEHGANPNVTYREQVYRQRLDGEECIWEEFTPLHVAGRSGCTEVVKTFLGADNVTSGIVSQTLALALRRDKCPPDLIDLLIKQGADINHTEVGDWPLIHQLTYQMFPQQQLDLFFLHGGNINMEHGIDRTGLKRAGHTTPLECAVQHNRYAHINTARWLIRRGADVSHITFTSFEDYFVAFCHPTFPRIPLILLQAGMRVSHGAHRQLGNMEVALSAWLQEDRGSIYRTVADNWDQCDRQDADTRRTVQGMWEQLKEAEEEELQRVQSNHKKSTFPEYYALQMVDLQEFSDESLHVYPEDTYLTSCGSTSQEYSDESLNVHPEYTYLTTYGSTRQEYLNLLDEIHRVLEFLSQPRMLQWQCRLCIRDNLVSLQPSVVKTLPLPARLKRYILCHEI